MGDDGDHILSFADARKIRYGTTGVSLEQLTDFQLGTVLDDIQVEFNSIANPGNETTKVTATNLVAIGKKIYRTMIYKYLKRIRYSSLNIRKQQPPIQNIPPMDINLTRKQEQLVRRVLRSNRSNESKVFSRHDGEAIY